MDAMSNEEAMSLIAQLMTEVGLTVGSAVIESKGEEGDPVFILVESRIAGFDNLPEAQAAAILTKTDNEVPHGESIH